MPADAAPPAPASSAVAPPPPAVPDPHTVEAIFARAERVFERRVDHLLQAKRDKALHAGTPFNARKAKRDARTVAGREKLDALVRRLADLATVQQALLGQDGRRIVAAVLDGAAAVVVGVAALEAAEVSSEAECVKTDDHPVKTDDADAAKDCLETSSCSDDCCSVGAANAKDFRDAPVPEPVVAADRHMFEATESVVNFVLECEDELTPVAPPAVPCVPTAYDAVVTRRAPRADYYARWAHAPPQQPAAL